MKKSGYSESKIAKELKISKRKILEVTKNINVSKAIHLGSKREAYYNTDFVPKPQYSFKDLSAEEKDMFLNSKPWDALIICWE